MNLIPRSLTGKLLVVLVGVGFFVLGLVLFTVSLEGAFSGKEGLIWLPLIIYFLPAVLMSDLLVSTRLVEDPFIEMVLLNILVNTVILVVVVRFLIAKTRRK